MTDHCPLVTALCPTYGRFQRLREALACFLAQDYPNKQLIILNDAPCPTSGLQETAGWKGDKMIGPYEASGNVHVINVMPFPNLGAKRQALLEEAVPFCNQGETVGYETDAGFADEWIEPEMPRYCAHWDDDDLYLPWHLSMCVQALEEGATWEAGRPKKCVQPHGAWYMPGGEVHGIHHNVFEGQMVFDRQRALELGGYPPKHSGQAADLMRKFNGAGEFNKFEPWPGPSYVYRWDGALGHISAIADSGKGLHEGKNATALKEFQRRNQDFGDGEALEPADLTPLWVAVLKSARKELSNDDYAAFEDRLNATEPQSSQRKERV